MTQPGRTSGSLFETFSRLDPRAEPTGMCLRRVSKRLPDDRPFVTSTALRFKLRPMALSPYQQLEQEFRLLHAFRGASSILRWDAAVMMPRGSADVRGEQLAALETESHALLTSPRVSRLLARAEANSAGLEDWQSANLREMRRERDQAIATPQNLVSRLAKATARAEVKWVEA